MNLSCHFEVFVKNQLKLKYDKNIPSHIFWGKLIQANFNWIMLRYIGFFLWKTGEKTDHHFILNCSYQHPHTPPMFPHSYSGLPNMTNCVIYLITSFTICPFLWNVSSMISVWSIISPRSSMVPGTCQQILFNEWIVS